MAYVERWGQENHGPWWSRGCVLAQASWGLLCPDHSRASKPSVMTGLGKVRKEAVGRRVLRDCPSLPPGPWRARGTGHVLCGEAFTGQGGQSQSHVLQLRIRRGVDVPTALPTLGELIDRIRM